MTAQTIVRPQIDNFPKMTPRNGLIIVASLVIPNGESLAPAIDLEDYRLAQIIMPAAWTAANLTVKVSPDDVDYGDLYNAAGVEYVITAAASRVILLPLVDFYGIRYLQLRSGTTGTSVNQGGARTLKVMAVP